MPRKCLNETDKEEIVLKYTKSLWTQEACANYYNVHRKTIYNVLREAGVLELRQTCSKRDAQMLALLKQHGVKLPQLREMLKKTKQGSKRAA